MSESDVEGTRITVESILEALGTGQTIEQVLEAHPRLTREGVLAAVRFGAEVLRADGLDVTYVAEHRDKMAGAFTVLTPGFVPFRPPV